MIDVEHTAVITRRSDESDSSDYAILLDAAVEYDCTTQLYSGYVNTTQLDTSDRATLRNDEME